VACGTGIVARLAANRVRAGRIVGLDINSGMLATARSVTQRNGPSIEWCVASALDMPFPDRAFDLVLCQLGLQFFPDRLAALRECWRVLKLDGRLALNVYASIEQNPVAHVMRTPWTAILAHQHPRRGEQSTPSQTWSSCAKSSKEHTSGTSRSAQRRRKSGSLRRRPTCG
jgi:ubiquinone/menaquinone biosynthesis C-methylase UbiE